MSDKRFAAEDKKYFLAQSSKTSEQWAQALLDSTNEPGKKPGVVFDTEANKEFLLQVRIIFIHYFILIFKKNKRY